MKHAIRLLITFVCATLWILAGASPLASPGHAQGPTATPGVADNALVRADSNRIASDSATVTLVEFGDYGCSDCAVYYPIVKQLLTSFQGKLTFVFRNYTLPDNKNSFAAAQAAEAAGNQGKFWEMHDHLFETQSTWAQSPSAGDLFVQYAQSLGLNLDRFKADVSSDAIEQKIARDVDDGDLLRIDATPTFFLNGFKIQNPRGYDDFKALIDGAISKAPAAEAAPAYHIHADFKVYVEGKALDFSADKYQSVEGQEKDPAVHLHDNNGNLVHVHEKGVTLGRFFKALGMSLTSSCFATDAGQQYCSNSAESLKMFVNGQPNAQFDAYPPQDLDRILVTYGSESGPALQKQIDSVTDTACIYSLKCPERGTPPAESCVGGSGSKCSK
jgi:protein-disulfide isomerase